jgi:hypothetical protein
MEPPPPGPFFPTNPAPRNPVWGEAPGSGPEPPWPPPEAWTEVSDRPQFTDGRARCTKIAVCDDSGQPVSLFCQGERAHFFAEFEVQDEIRLPSGTLELVDASAVLVHGKATYQVGSDLPPALHAGGRVRFHWSIEQRLSLGKYRFTVQLAEVAPELYRQYVSGPLTYRDFTHNVRKHCRLEEAGAFEVTWGPEGKLSHHGVADLPGSVQARVLEGRSNSQPVRAAARGAGDQDAPTVFHVTHWKAGSQWIHKILKSCCPETVVDPGVDQLWRYPVQRGRVYPTVYLSKQDLDRIGLPEGSTRFVVIRDLRDTLVSAYFSFKGSHPVIPGYSIPSRQFLQETDVESGLVHLMDHFLEKCSAIQLSWLEAQGEVVLKYEDLLTDDLSLLEFALIDHCRLPVTREALREAVLGARFEALTGGRPRGSEDVAAHERKGVAGDWQNLFTDKVKRAFKARYGGLLVAAGYEADLSW